MAQVETLEIEHNFQEDVVNQAAGRAPIDAKKLDQTLASVAENQNLINENLKMLQRDDGQLKDAVVGPAQMQRSVINLVKEFNLRGAYIPASYYAKNDAVDYNGSLWVCAKPHNSTSVFVESNWLRYGASGAEDVSVAAQQAQQAATAAAASLRNANTAAATAETLRTQTEAAATNASNAANSAATQAQQVSQNAGIATSAKNRAETAALKAEAAANSGAITTPKPISSANLAILTGVYYTTGNVPTAEQYKVDVIATDTQIIQTATAGDGSIFTRTFPLGTTSDYPVWKSQSEDVSIRSAFTSKFRSIAEMLGVLSPINGQTAVVDSYYVGTGLGGGTFVFDSTKSAQNNGVTVFAGWVRLPQPIYYFEDAGIVEGAAANIGSNIAAFARLNHLPSGSNVSPAVASGFYVGFFDGIIGLRFDLRDATIALPEGEGYKSKSHISMKASFVDYVCPSQTLAIGVDTITVTGQIPGIKKDALVVLWDRMFKIGGQYTHEEANLVDTFNYSANTNLTTIKLKHPLLSPFDAGHSAEKNIVVKVFSNPFDFASVENGKINNDAGGTYRPIFIEGAINAKVAAVKTTKTYGHAVSFSRCYAPQMYDIEMLDPLAVGGGQGYGVTLMSCRNLFIRNLSGRGLRHILDMDSIYGLTYIENIHCDNAESSMITLAHNGFAGGHFFVKNITGTFKGYASYAVVLSKQGFESGADAANSAVDFTSRIVAHNNLNVTLDDVNITFKNDANVAQSQHHIVYLQTCGKSLSMRNLNMQHDAPALLNTSTVASVVRVYGAWDEVKVNGAKQDKGTQCIDIRSSGFAPAKLGDVVLDNISSGISNAPIYVSGYNLKANKIRYGATGTAAAFIVNHVGPAGDASPEVADIRDVRRDALATEARATYTRTSSTIKEGFIECEQAGIFNFVYVAGGGITVAADTVNFWKASQIQVSSTEAVTVSTSFFIPPPLYSGQKVKLKNTGSFAITIPAGSFMQTKHVLAAGASVELQSGLIAGSPSKWSVIS